MTNKSKVFISIACIISFILGAITVVIFTSRENSENKGSVLLQKDTVERVGSKSW